MSRFRKLLVSLALLPSLVFGGVTLDLPLTTDLVDTVNGLELSITRATTATVVDTNAILRTVQSGEARFSGTRRVENLGTQSEDFSHADWVASNITADTDTLTATAANGTALQTYTALGGADYTFAVEIQRVTGSGDIQLTVDGGATWTTITVTASYVRLSRTETGLTAGSTSFGIRLVTDTDVVNVRNAQLENVSGQPDPAPSEYQATTTAAVARLYDTRRRPNLALHAQAFDNASWTKIGSTVDADVGVGPFGTTVADRINVTTANSRHTSFQEVPHVPGSVLSASVYVKDDGAGFATVAWVIGNLDFISATFDLTTGAQTDTEVGGTSGSIADSGSSDEGNGWWRIWVTGSQSGTGQDYITAAASDSGTPTYFAGQATYTGVDGEDVLVYGAQLEKGSVKTPYHSTTTTVASSGFDSPAGLYEQHENTILQSEDLTTSWTNVRTTETANSTIAPNGTMTADSVNEDGTAANTHGMRQAVTLVSGAQTISTYAKASNRPWLGIDIDDSAGTNRTTYFDLKNGALGTVHANFLGAGIEAASATIPGAKAGWYRTWVITEAPAGADNLTFYSAEADNDNTFDGLSQESTILWGAMLQTGSVATTYSKTTTAAVTGGFWESAPGLLVEEARTNICLQSEDFEDAAWTAPANTTFTAAAGSAPDGATTATDMKHDDTAEAFGQSITVTADTVHTWSLYIHSGTTGAHDWVTIRYKDNAAANGIEAWFDLTNNGAVGTSQTFGTGTTLTGTFVEVLSNAWFRISLTGQLASGITASRVVVLNADADGSAVEEATNSTFIWGGQLEAGAFPTSYKPTVASSVTRNKDDVQTTDVSWFKDTVGTFYFAGSLPVDGADMATPFDLEANISNHIGMRYRTGTTLMEAIHFTGTGDDGLMSPAGAYTAGSLHRTAMAFAANDGAAVTDGGTVSTDNTLSVPTTNALDTLRIGASLLSANHWNDHIGHIRYWDERLVNATLDYYTSNGLEGDDAIHISLVVNRLRAPNRIRMYRDRRAREGGRHTRRRATTGLQQALAAN